MKAFAPIVAAALVAVSAGSATASAAKPGMAESNIV